MTPGLKDSLDIYGAVASLLGAAVALFSWWQALQANKESKEIARKIAASLSTRSVGLFPEYLKDVAKLIASAECSLKIMAGVPSHGSFTRPDLWIDISTAIQKKMHGPRADGQPAIMAELLYSDDERLRLSYRAPLASYDTAQKWETY